MSKNMKKFFALIAVLIVTMAAWAQTSVSTDSAFRSAIANGANIIVTGGLTGSSIGVWMESNTGTFTSGYSSHNGYDPATIFTSDFPLVINNNTDAGSVVIHSLTVNFAAGGQKVYFPMAATAAKNAGTMIFRHLTGGLKLTLKNKKTSGLNVAKLVVTVTNVSNEGAIYKDLKPEWVGGMLPALPEEEIGNISGDPGAEFVSTMTLYLRDEVNAYKQLAAKDSSGDELVFCMPMLAKSVRYLRITGYDDSGNQIFTTPQKVIENPFDVARNIMYTIPTINIE